MAYLKLLLNPVDNQAFLRVVNTPPRGIGAQTLQSVVGEAQRSVIPLMNGARIVAEKNKNIRKFVELMDRFADEAGHCSVAELIAYIVEKSDYGPRLKGLDDVSTQSRLENIQELTATASGFPLPEDSSLEALRAFLDRASLTTSDERVSKSSGEMGVGEQEAPTPTVSLMTLHLAKGLEFRMYSSPVSKSGFFPTTVRMMKNRLSLRNVACVTSASPAQSKTSTSHER